MGAYDTATPKPAAQPDPENIAATLARVLPKAELLHTTRPSNGGEVSHIAVPKGFELKTVDDEPFLPGPRRATSTAKLVDAASFLAYVQRHKGAGTSTVVWCEFNPTTFALKFTAVFDDHGAHPGWRKHRAVFEPRTAPEWDTWIGHNKKDKGQVEFAEFIERNEKDIAGGDGLPSSLQMMTMATQFEATGDARFKSKVRLQSGGVELQYVDAEDEETITRMRLFERFQIGIPVFWKLPDGSALKAWPMEARLKYRVQGPKVTFWYDLIRPDIVHESAALQLIQEVRSGLEGVTLMMGGCE